MKKRQIFAALIGSILFTSISFSQERDLDKSIEDSTSIGHNGSINITKDLNYQAEALIFVDTTITIPLLDFRNTKITDILTVLSKQYGINMWIDPQITKIATIRMQNARLNDVIWFFIDNYNLEFEKAGTLLKITEGPPQKPAQIAICDKGQLTLDLKSIDIPDLIKLISDSCGIVIVPSRGLAGTVTGFIKDVEPETGLRAVLNSNGFDLVLDEGLYYLTSLDATDTGPKAVRGVSVKDGKVNLNVVNANLRSLVDNISDKLGLEAVIYGNIEGSITAKFDGLSAEKVFDYILRGTQYTYSVEDSIFFIGPSSMADITVTKLIRLKHLQAEGVRELLPEQIASKAVIKLIKEHNGIMIIGPLQVVKELENYISEIDHPPAQVLIEALVVDYTITDKLEYGIKMTSFPLSDSARQGQKYYPDIDVTGSSEGLNRDLQYWGDKLNISNIGTLPDDFYARLTALAREGKANIRSRPRIATLNGHEAKIDVGTTQYYLLRTETTYGVGQQTPTSQISEKFQTIEASMSLTITPWVNASNEIIATIHPEFNTPQGSFDPDIPPTINHRILDSNVRLRDGETIVLGGLIQTTETEQVEKFPILGDIPILGWLFQNRSKIKANSELVIYITPHIYYGSEGAVDISKYED